MTLPAMRRPPIVSPGEWEAARQQLLVKEKAHTRARDALAAERRRMPWMAVEQAYAFDLDDHHHFIAGKPMLVCGNTADMLGATRYAPHFRIQGDKSAHFGLFDCGPGRLMQTSEAGAKAGCC